MIFSGGYKRSKAFTGFIFLMALWWYADYLMGQTEEYIGIWRLYNFCNILNAFLFYVFANEITKKYNKKGIIISGAFCIFFLFINYYDNLLIPDDVLEITGIELLKTIHLYNLFVIYYCVSLLMGTWWIYKHYKDTKIARNILLLSCILTIIGDSYSFWTVYFESLYNFPYIAYLICFLPYFVTYLIFRHRLFDARSTLLQMLQGGFIVFIGVIIGWFIYSWFASYGFYAHFDIPLITIVLWCIGTIVYLSRSGNIHTWFQLSDIKILEKWISDFLSSNAVYESPNEVIESIRMAIKDGLNIENVELLWRKEIKKYPEISKALSYGNKKSITSISKKEAENEQEQSKKQIKYLEEVRWLGELCVPIYIEKELGYILVLPEKNSQANYTTNEKKLINAMRPKIALSMQILEYNQTLREEVERQTLQINEQKIKLEESYKKLEALDHEKDVFMNMAAHELRTPMTIIRGYADILLDGGSGAINEAQKKLVENMYKSSESLIALVNDLLDLSRIDAGKMELKYEVCDIKELVRGTFESFATLMGKKSMNFTLKETIDTDLIFTTDRAKITLLFNNLISNAYKYTPEKWEVEWIIGTEMKDNESWLTFSVKDSWVWIPEAELAHVFDRFASISTHNNIASTIQSTGLWLSIVKKIVTGMGGTVDVTSTVGKWTTFSISLPYTPKKVKQPEKA
jgi:signal transduction histidine kinase